jgi:hypothetical protein
MKKRQRILKNLVLCIFLLNIFIMAIPIESEGSENSDHFFVSMLRAIGLEPKESKTFRQVPSLTKADLSSTPQDQSYSDQMNFRLSDYFTPGWADTRWQYRKNITIDSAKVSSDLTNFPVYIEVYDSDLPNDAQASGDDIFFTNASGHILDHEIESYNRVYNSTHARLIAWVETNLSGSQDVLLSMYYGNPTAISQENPDGVWDDNYEFVLHMNQDPSSSDILDSTQNDFDFKVEPTGNMNSDDLVNGIAGKAITFDGSDDFLYLPVSEGFVGPRDKMTFEYWIMFPSGAPSARDYVGAPAIASGDPYLAFYNGEAEMHVETGSDAGPCDTNQNFGSLTGTWQHIVFIWDGTGAGDFRVYLNGTVEDVDNVRLGTHTAWNTFSIGTEDDDIDGPGGDAEGDRFIHATLSEFRLSNDLRSPNWIATEFENQNDYASFYSVDSEENYGDYFDWDYIPLSYRKEIVIDSTKVSGDLTNFPVLLDIYDSDLNNKGKVQADGDDILFCDASGNKLDHEIELFDQTGNGTHAHLVSWIKIPYLSGTTDTTIYMYFGNRGFSSQANPTAVWNSNYKGVWHLGQNPAETPPQVLDSTSNNNDGTTSGLSSGDLITGKVDGGLNFPDAGVPYVNMGDQASLNMGSGDFSLELWFRYDSADNNAGPLAGKGAYSGGGKRYFIAITSGNGNIKAEIDDDTTKYEFESVATYGDDIWHHAVMVRDGNWLRFYIDGSEIAAPLDITGEGNLDNVGMPFTINTLSADYLTPTFTDDATVQMDEVRVSNIARSANWITTEYTNQNNTDEFYSISPIESNENTVPYLRYKKDITIDNSVVSGSGDLYDFPFLLDLYDEDLHLASKVQADGDDIAFTDVNGMRLNHEIEDFSQNFNSTHAHLIAWVELPILSKSTDTIIYIRYGNSIIESLATPDKLWENYGGVWHLDDDFLDSSTNNNDGTNYQSDDVSAQVADGQDFDGVNDYINVGSGSSIDNIFAVDNMVEF